MKAQRIIPALVFTIALSLTLVGCNDSSGGNGSAGNSTGSSGGNTSASGNAANSPTAADSSAANSNSGGSGNLKLTVVKFNLVTQGKLNFYVGVVRNDGSASVSNPVMHLLDDSGKPVDDNASETMLNQVVVLPPDQSVGFKILYSGSPIQHPQFSFDLETTDLTPLKLTVADSQLTNSAFGIADSPDEITVAGDVTNNDDALADLWRVNAIGYDASGNVLDVSTGQAADSTQKLTAHSTIKFVVNLLPGNAKVTKYDLFVWGVHTAS